MFLGRLMPIIYGIKLDYSMFGLSLFYVLQENNTFNSCSNSGVISPCYKTPLAHGGFFILKRLDLIPFIFAFFHLNTVS